MRATRLAAVVLSLAAYAVPLAIYTGFRAEILLGNPLNIMLLGGLLLLPGIVAGRITATRAGPRTLRGAAAAAPILPVSFAIAASSALLLGLWFGPEYYRGTDIRVPLFLSSAFPAGAATLFVGMGLDHGLAAVAAGRGRGFHCGTWLLALVWMALVALHGLNPILGFGSYTAQSDQWVMLYLALQLVTLGAGLVLARRLNPWGGRPSER